MLKTHTLLAGVAFMSLSALLLAADAPTSQPADSAVGQKTVTPSGLAIVEQGSDEGVAAAGDRVWVDYTGKLENGTKFDSSADHPEQPLIFTIGKHEVIQGWDEGIAGMKVGQKRQLVVPPKLGYGEQAVGPIPPNSTLIFDVQLLGLKKAR